MTNIKTNKLDEAYQSAVQFAQSHYENFPVVSFFLPSRLKKHVAVIYQFARQADDIADEGEFPISFRLMLLESYRKKLTNSIHGIFDNDFWYAFNDTVTTFNLTKKYFYDLLSAFEQDIVKSRYDTFDEILNYCERSANPVGRIILELFNIRDEKIFEYSDAVCTALQLTNFYQDISIDFTKNRIYLPLNELRESIPFAKEFGFSINLFELKKNNDKFKQLLKIQIDRTKNIFSKGESILNYLPKELKLQIKLTILGGKRILEKIERIDYDTLNKRPTLSKIDLIILFFKALIS